MSESGAQLPLAAPTKTTFAPVPPQPKVIQETWKRLRRRMEEEGASKAAVDSARVTFAAGVYASSVAVLNERAHYQELSAAAAWVDRG